MASSPKTILIVDDNLEDRRTYHRYLDRDPIDTYNIIEAETAEEGLELVASHSLDLILLDFNLPDLNGLEFVAESKVDRDRLPPIIILTGEGSEAIAVEVMKAGVKDYLIKGKTNGDSFRFAVRSVLEQSRLQQLARRNEHKFRVCVENMLDCFGIYTSIRNENARIIGFRTDYLNESACKDNLFDWQEHTESVVCPLNIFDFQADLFTLCCEVIETGKAVSTEYILKSPKSGNRSKVFEIKINRLEDGFVAVWRDISERIAIEKALESSEAKFRVLVTQAPVGIFQTNCQGDCVYVNPSWLEITGLDKAKAMGKGWSYALHPQDKARVYHEWYETARLGKVFTSEYRFCSPGGKTTWVSGKAVAMYGDDGKRIGYFGTIIDISDRKRAEALSKQQQERLIYINQHLKQTTDLLTRRNRELDEFTYVVSHDLKAPLRAVCHLSEWLEEDLEDKLDDDTKHNFKLLKSRVGRMQMFIQSLLEYSRVGKEQTPTETVVVKDLLIDIIDFLLPPPTFAIAIGEGMPTLDTQKVALEQVFTNLIGNAIKHHPRQTGKIAISATEDSQYYYFTVTDDGNGIAPEHRERVFGIFQTLSSRDDTEENTGIGLSIVKKIVENQGGTIDLESQLGRGTTFSFSWPK